MSSKISLKTILVDIMNEVDRAKELHPGNFNSPHEGYAVILEEVEELWDEIKKKKSEYNLDAQYNEAIQAAAMLVRFASELC